eukprot:5348352-Prymnesium_polylepis.1
MHHVRTVACHLRLTPSRAGVLLMTSRRWLLRTWQASRLTRLGFAPVFDAAVECASTSGIPLHAIVNSASVQCASRISDQR